MRLVLFALALAAGCTTARSDAAGPSGPAVAAPVAAGPVVMLERTVCYGTCPAYTVSATADGRVVFEGREHVARAGRHEARVAPAVVAGLVARAAAIGHAGYPASLTGTDVCDTLLSDNPAAITTVRSAAGTSVVARDGGCMGFRGQAELTAFEDAIDTALGTAAFLGTR